jgi:hypothetical protein
VTTHQGDWPVPKLVSVLLLFFLFFFRPTRTPTRKGYQRNNGAQDVEHLVGSGSVFFFWSGPTHARRKGKESEPKRKARVCAGAA